MHASQVWVDSIANNVANVNTPGYRRSQVEFSDLLYQEAAQGRLLLGNGVTVMSITRDLSPAPLEATGQATDIAVSGAGFLMVEGPGGERAYTRDGSLRVDSAGRLVTAGGRWLVIEPPAGVAGPVVIPADAVALTVGRDGALTYQVPGQEDAVAAGQVMVAVPVPTVQGRSPDLWPIGDNLYLPAPETMMETRVPGSDGSGELRQGYLERSNVSLAQELTDLIQAQRAYELSARSITTADEMLAVANGIWRG